MAGQFSEVLQNKLWIVTGKGGVGKTTLAASLGLLSADQGDETLLVETHGLNHLGELLGVGSVGYHPKKVSKNLWLSQIDPESALEEYLLQQIKVRFIYNAVFKNRYVRHFMDAAPGLVELLTIGKIWALTQGKEMKGNKRDFRRVIVDAPSTGHGISLMTVPEVVAKAVRVGPLKSKSEQILNLLRDPKATNVWLATLPEDMPVTETLEMAVKLEDQVKVKLGPIVVNALWPDLLSDKTQESIKKSLKSIPLLNVYMNRLNLSYYYLDKLKSGLPQEKFVELPLIYDNFEPLEVAQSLSAALKKSLGVK